MGPANAVTASKHNVEPGDLIRTRAGWSPAIRTNAKTATVPTGYSWTDTVPWSRVGEVVKAEEFTPDQVRELLAASGEDKHRTAGLRKTLARAEPARAPATEPVAANRSPIPPETPCPSPRTGPRSDKHGRLGRARTSRSWGSPRSTRTPTSDSLAAARLALGHRATTGTGHRAADGRGSAR